MYRMNNSGELFPDELTNWLINEAGFNQSKCKISLNYKYAPYVSNLVVLSYVDKCVYLYISDELVEWFVDKIGNILHVNFLEYAQ